MLGSLVATTGQNSWPPVGRSAGRQWADLAGPWHQSRRPGLDTIDHRIVHRTTGPRQPISWRYRQSGIPLYSNGGFL